MADEYVGQLINLIRETQSDEEIGDLINRIYEDGFEDGVNEAEQLSND